MTELSVKDKLNKAYSLACQIVDRAELKLEESMRNIVYGYVDGIMHKYFEKMINGQCSLQASIDFNMEDEEQRLDSDITKFEEILAG